MAAGGAGWFHAGWFHDNYWHVDWWFGEGVARGVEDTINRITWTRQIT